MEGPEIVKAAAEIGTAGTVAVSVGKEAVKQVSPLLSLLAKPSAELIGKEWRDRLKEHFAEAKRQRREKNLGIHLERVRKRLNTPDPISREKQPTISNIALLEDWTDGAQDIDPDENVLSEIWERLLIEMAKGANVERILIEKLRAITPLEAHVFLAFKTRRYWYPRKDFEFFCLQRLTSHEITRRALPRALKTMLFASILLLASSVTVWFVPPLTTIMNAFYAQDPYTRESLKMLPLAVLGILIAIGAVFWLTHPYGPLRWELTWVGEKLLTLANAKSRKMESNGASANVDDVESVASKADS